MGAQDGDPGYTEERDELVVVDWTSAPDTDLAKNYRFLSRPCWANKRGDRAPFDRADADVDKRGWIAKQDGVYPYPLIGSSGAEMGAIGGVGKAGARRCVARR